MSAVPPPPRGAENMPAPPPFGWIGNPRHLTIGEMDEICLYTGKTQEQLAGLQLLPYAAVAYARRHDPDLYPWSVAALLPFLQLADGEALHAQAEQEEEAQAVAEAIEAGEVPVNPS